MNSKELKKVLNLEYLIKSKLKKQKFPLRLKPPYLMMKINRIKLQYLMMKINRIKLPYLMMRINHIIIFLKFLRN